MSSVVSRELDSRWPITTRHPKPRRWKGEKGEPVCLCGIAVESEDISDLDGRALHRYGRAPHRSLWISLNLEE